jgi:hypothetical protein
MRVNFLVRVVDLLVGMMNFLLRRGKFQLGRGKFSFNDGKLLEGRVNFLREDTPPCREGLNSSSG